jgi:hypothetical protein
MSKARADNLMAEFFAQRRQERAEEQELIQDRLKELKFGIDHHISSKEWVGGNLLNSVNFLKQDASAPPPKTKSGTITQNMFSKVTSKEKARELAQKADTAGAMLGSALHGAIATMTAEAASSDLVGTVRQQGSEADMLTRSSTPRTPRTSALETPPRRETQRQAATPKSDTVSAGPAGKIDG